NLATLPTFVRRSGVGCALPDLRQLPANVIEELIVNRRLRAELFFGHSSERRIDDACGIVALCTTEVAAEAACSPGAIVVITHRVSGGGIRHRLHMTSEIVHVAHRVFLSANGLACHSDPT